MGGWGRKGVVVMSLLVILVCFDFLLLSLEVEKTFLLKKVSKL